jgi:NAD(P)-dependent dehydrogenase (short-subunit alcohol dehydrogenase family)
VLVNRLLPLMGATSRLIVVSSAGHRFANIDLADPNFEHSPYEPFVAYGRSKTANILFAVAFDQRYRQRGKRAASVHPGAVQTELNRYLDPRQVQTMIDRTKAAASGTFRWKTIPQGAATSVWAAVIAEANAIGGRYCENCHVGSIVADDVTISAVSEGVRAYALDPASAEALWRKSEELVGEAFHG